MSEAQFIKKITPSIRISSTDSHRMLTPPQAQGRAGTRPPRGGGGQPLKAGAPDVQFRAQPMDVVMHGGGSVKVERPGGAPAPRTTAARAPAGEAIAKSTQLSPEQIEICGQLVSAHLRELERAEAPAAEIAIARGAIVTLAKLRQK